MLLYLFSYLRIFRKKLLLKFISPDKFHIGYSFEWSKTGLTKFIYISNPTNGYYADPFVIFVNSEYFIFCEFYDYELKKGRIDVFKLDSQETAIHLGTCIDEKFHLSFPFIFQVENELFIVPESKSQNEIILYKCTKWPLRWERFVVLIPNIQAVDNLIFYHEKQWWILSTKSITGDLNCQSELYLYYSTDLFSSNWTPHKNNPIIVNSYFGRNAGLYFDGEFLFRCSQAHKKGLYGSEVNFHKILKINNNDYIEVLVPEMCIPNCHTFDSKFGLTVIDKRLRIKKT
jgi:hypothetical protein